MNNSTLPYRPCVGMMLLNKDNQVFVGQRIDSQVEAWQMPQGGIDEGEDYEVAAKRELSEEIGTNHIEIVARSRDWLYYDLPQDLVGKVWKGRFKGQKQIWFLMRFMGRDSDINIATEHPEFNAWKWISPNDLPTYIVEFKRALYRDILNEFRDYIPNL